jgi:hypothetical protein
MKVEILTLCDAATDQNGKLNILGTFDTILAPQIPLIYQNCVVAVKMRWEKIEEGKKKVRITFSDADGKPVIPPLEAEINVQVSGNPQNANTTATNFILNIQQLKLERTGEYAIDLAINGRIEGSLPLYVIPAPVRRLQS